MATEEQTQTQVVVRHWRAVNEDGGIAFSLSEQEDFFHARLRVQTWVDEHPAYHLEGWEQRFWVTEAEWERVS